MSSSERKQPQIPFKEWRLATVAVCRRLPILAVRIFGIWVFAHVAVAFPVLMRGGWLANWNLLSLSFYLEISAIVGWSAAFAFGQLWGISLFYASLPLSAVVNESWILGWQAPFDKIVNGRPHLDPSGMMLADVCMIVIVGLTHNVVRSRTASAGRVHGGCSGNTNFGNISESNLAQGPGLTRRVRSPRRAMAGELFHRDGRRGTAAYGIGFRRLIWWIPRVLGALLLPSALWNIQAINHLWQNIDSRNMAGHGTFVHWQVLGWLLSFVAVVPLLLRPAWGCCAYAAMVSVFAFSGQIALPFSWTINRNLPHITRPEQFKSFLITTLLDAAILCVCGIVQSLTVSACRFGAPGARSESGSGGNG